jgi:two-component system chemotaxis sensor kinase CheA
MAVVLLADDDFSALESLAKRLEEAGHRVIRAGDGIDAFRILIGQRVEVVVADEHMPGMSGAALVAAMRADQRFAKLPAILLTKPVDVPSLLAAIDRR